MYILEQLPASLAAFFEWKLVPVRALDLFPLPKESQSQNANKDASLNREQHP
jgi:hypothetical protein